MKILKVQRLQVAGLTKLNIFAYSTSLGVLFLGVFNLLDQMNKNQDILLRSYLTIPFIGMFVLSFFVSSRHYLIIVTLVCATFPLNFMDYNLQYSAILFIVSFSIVRNLSYGIVIIFFTLTSVTISSLVYDLSIIQCINQIMAYTAVYLMYYFLIYSETIRKSKNIITPTAIDIDNTVILIMNQYIQGHTWEQISTILKLSVTGGRVQKMVKKEMTQKGFHNYAHFCTYMADKGIISTVDKKTNTY